MSVFDFSFAYRNTPVHKSRVEPEKLNPGDSVTNAAGNGQIVLEDPADSNNEQSAKAPPAKAPADSPSASESAPATEAPPKAPAPPTNAEAKAPPGAVLPKSSTTAEIPP